MAVTGSWHDRDMTQMTRQTAEQPPRRPARDDAGRSRRQTRSRRGFVPFHTPVRGYRYAPRPPGAAHPQAGQGVGLRRETGHPRDPWAVAVWIRSHDGVPWRVGYLERAVAARLGPRLDAGERIASRVAGWAPEPDERWWRPVIVVEPGSAVTSSSRPPEILRRVEHEGQATKTA
jgi:hypothetical protein